MSGRRVPPRVGGPALARAAAATLALATAAAFAQPTWVADPDGAYPGRQAGALGVAYVEAASFPAGLTQEQTGLFVVCDGAAGDAFDLFLWVGAVPAGAVDAAGTLEVLTRRGADAARSARWLVDVDSVVGEVVVANANVRRLLVDDLRRGGSLAVRLATDPAAGAAQPTFVFEVDGFPEAVLDCPAQAAAASDPFAGAPVVPVDPTAAPADPFAGAPVAPVDPFAGAPAAPDPFAAPAAPVDPFADAPRAPVAPADPFAAPPVAPAPPTAAPVAPTPPATSPPPPGDAFDDPIFTDPTTGLLSLFGTLDDFAPLPPRVELTSVVAEPSRAIAYANHAGGFEAIGGFCNAEGGGDNGFVVELGSPAFASYGDSATLILFDGDTEVGYVEIGVYVDDIAAAGFIRYDEDELGFLRALDAFDTLEVVLSGDGLVGAEAYWSFATADLRAAIGAMACAP